MSKGWGALGTFENRRSFGPHITEKVFRGGVQGESPPQKKGGNIPPNDLYTTAFGGKRRAKRGG